MGEKRYSAKLLATKRYAGPSGQSLLSPGKAMSKSMLDNKDIASDWFAVVQPSNQKPSWKIFVD